MSSKAQGILREQVEKYFFGPADAVALPAEFVAPTK